MMWRKIIMSIGEVIGSTACIACVRKKGIYEVNTMQDKSIGLRLERSNESLRFMEGTVSEFNSTCRR